jgi:hypothetical protein
MYYANVVSAVVVDLGELWPAAEQGFGILQRMQSSEFSTMGYRLVYAYLSDKNTSADFHCQYKLQWPGYLSRERIILCKGRM